jgi:hypothetical protein
MVIKINGTELPNTVSDAVSQAKDHVMDRLIDYGSDLHTLVVNPSLPHYGSALKSMYMVHTQAMADTFDVAVVTGKTVLHTGIEIVSMIF